MAIGIEEKRIEKNEDIENVIIENVKEIVDKRDLSPNQKLEAVVKIVERKSEIYSGPIPHPEHLRQYDEIEPGSAKLIIQMFIEQSKHRRKQEDKILDADIKGFARGQVFGFIILLLAIIGGFILIAFEKDGIGLASIITAIAGLSLSYFYGKK